MTLEQPKTDLKQYPKTPTIQPESDQSQASAKAVKPIPLKRIIIAITLAIITIGGMRLAANYFQVKLGQKLATPRPTVLPTISTQADTASWKTYIDSKWGYQISYPATWEIPKETHPVSDYTVGFNSSDRGATFKAEVQGAPTYTLFVTVYQKTKTNSTWEEEAKLRGTEVPQCALDGPCPTLPPKEIIKKSNNQFKEYYSVLTSTGSKHTIIPLPNEGEHYINIWTWYTWPGNDSGLYDQILSTFTFFEAKDELEENEAHHNLDFWYVIEVRQKENASPPPYYDYAYLRKPIADALGLQDYEVIEKIVADTSKTKWGTVNFNGNYYIFVSKTHLSEKQYEDSSLSIDVKKLSDQNLIPYLLDNNYCKQNSDCTIRNAFYCTYGAFNYFESLKDHVSGCESMTFDDEIKQSVDSSCHKLLYQNPSCRNNECIATQRTYEPIPCD